MVKRTKEEALETRNHLLDTAEAVFHQKGVAQTTLHDIAQAAGLTRGAIYWHFKNKADLFNALCDRVTLPLETLTEAAASSEQNDPLADLRASVQFFFRQVVHDLHCRRVFDILLNKCEFVAELGPVVERDARVREEFARRFERLFRSAEKRGQLSPGLNHRLVVEGYQAFVMGIVRRWLLNPAAFDLEQDGGRLLDGFFEMVQVSVALRG